MERFAIKIDKSLRANLYKICRLCGIDNPDKVKVRDDANTVNLEDGEPELWKKVFDCIGLMITKDDKMPQFMCTLCVDKINDFFEFREMCYATDGQTRKLLGIKGEPKLKVPATAPSSSLDLKTEDIKEPIPEVTPQRTSRKRRNADLDVTKDMKIDIVDDIKPSTTNVTTSATKKKRIKLSITTETETKTEPGTKAGPASKVAPISAKKEPTGKVTPKAEPTVKIALSKKRLKAEPIVKENKKEIKTAKITKLMKKKLKVEIAPVVVQEPQQPSKKKKLEVIKLKKLPQLVVKAEKLKKGILDTKIKEETPVAATNPTPAPAASSKTKSKCKEKCTICSEGFVNKVHLDKHVKTTHIPTVQRYHCVQCNETLKKNMEIKNHNLWHKLSKTPFKCGNCSENSCSIYTYSKHIRDCNQVAYLDSHIPDWHCPDCSDNYETTYLFNIHSCVSKKLVCPGCEKSLKWKEDYFKHIPTCAEAFHRIPPYMTSNIQVKNEAELPTSPVPPLTTLALPTTSITSATVQSTPSTRITPPQMDSNQCVVIPGNISLHEEAGPSSPSKSSRKGKRITKKDLKRFDKLLKSTMTTLVSIKHEPTQGEDGAVADGEQPSSSEVREQSEPPPPPDSPPGSPMPCGGDDFHHNGDDSDSADDQTPTKPVGTIKQEIIDEGYRDLYNNIEVNIKHEIEVNKNTAEDSPQKKTSEALTVAEESALIPKPILKLKITKEHGTLNSILMDSPKSEKKKKKKKRKEDRSKSPEKEEHNVDDNLVVPKAADVTVQNELPVEKDVAVEINVTINQNSALATNKAVVSESEEEPPMPLPGIIQIKKEINVPEIDEADEGASSQNTPSIVAASSGSLQISCVSEGVIFHRPEDNEEEMPQETPYSVMEKAHLTSEESDNWAEPIPSLELCVSSKEFTSPSLDVASSIQYAITQETEEEIDIKPRLEDLIPMLQIASVTSGAEVVDKPIKKPVKRKRRPTTAKPDSIPKIVSVSSGIEVASYHPEPVVPSVDAEDSIEKISENNENVFDFSQVKIKEEIVDPGYDEESSVSPLEEEEVQEDADEDEEVDEDADEDEEVDEEEEAEKEQEEEEEDVQIDPVISQKQAEENAYIANIDFNNLTIKQEKEYIDDGMQNSATYEENEGGEEEEDDEEEDESSNNDSEDDSSDDGSDKSDSESEREYRDLPSEDDENDKNDEQLPAAPKITTITAAKDKETPTLQTPLGLQILTVHSEFSCPQSSKKTELDGNSDDKLILISTTENETEHKTVVQDESQSKTNTGINEEVNKTYNCIEEEAIPMEVDVECPVPMHETTSNDGKSVDALEQTESIHENAERDGKPAQVVGENESILENVNIDEKSVEMRMSEINNPVLETSIVDGKPVQDIQSGNVTVETCSGKNDLEMTCIEGAEQASISQLNNLDDKDKATDATLIHGEACPESQEPAENSIKTPINRFETNLKHTDLPQICDDLESKANEQIVYNPYSYTEGQLAPQDLSPATPSQEVNLESSCLGITIEPDLDKGLYPGVSNVNFAEYRILPPGGMVGSNIEMQSVVETTPAKSESEQHDIEMMSIDQCYNTALRSIDRASGRRDGLCVGDFGEAAEENDNGEHGTTLTEIMPVVSNDGETLPTDFSGARLTNQCTSQEISLARLVETRENCQTLVEENPCELPPPPVHDVQQNSSEIPPSVQSVIDSQPSNTLNSHLSYSMDDHISYTEETLPTQLPNFHDNTLPTSSSLTENHQPNAFENPNILMDLGNAVGNSNSNMDQSYNHDRHEFNPNSQVPNENAFNIPTSQLDLQQFNNPGSSYASFNYSNHQSNFSDYQDLNPPTAGQLQTSLVQQSVVNQSSELSTNSLTNLSVLSEEVQNLLNEDTVTVNNFEFNDSVLRARSSALAPRNPVPIFNEFENLNEIAENNNNANIERELQDELGNVLADAIADRSNDDNVDDDNAMNENRANFDIT